MQKVLKYWRIKHLAVLIRLDVYFYYRLVFLRYPIDIKWYAAASYLIPNILSKIYPNEMSLSISFAMGI